jgi:predicted N-formylglutamate amidohydrolase
MAIQTQIVLTCEHAGNRVPAAYRPLFRRAESVLQSHRGWDPGAIVLARTFQRLLAVPLVSTDVTRLLVEPNRSVGHRHLFSEFTAALDGTAKKKILDRYYHPHRERVETWIAAQVAAGCRVLHLSLHTFTPQLNGQRRTADIGLLYDPSRDWERTLCHKWRAEIKSLIPELMVRRNYPYLGTADGFTTYLRRLFPRERYAGIELEVNQHWVAQPAAWRRLSSQLAKSTRSLV